MNASADSAEAAATGCVQSRQAAAAADVHNHTWRTEIEFNKFAKNKKIANYVNPSVEAAASGCAQTCTTTLLEDGNLNSTN